jgi:hypothetical protein
MKKEVPKFDEAFIPVLKILKNHDELSKQKLVNKTVNDYFKEFDNEIYGRIKSNNKIIIFDRVG